MKMLALVLFTLLTGTIAQADLKPPGTLVPTLCSRNEVEGVKQVCFAERVGVEGRYLTVRSEENVIAVYNILGEQELPEFVEGGVLSTQLNVQLESLVFPGGHTSIPFVPEKHELIFRRASDQDHRSFTLEGELSGSTQIHADKFQMMFRTMVTLKHQLPR